MVMLRIVLTVLSNIFIYRFQDWMPKVQRIDGRIDERNDKVFLVIKNVWEMQEPDVMRELSSSFACEDDDEEFVLRRLNIAPAEYTALFQFLSHIKNLKQLEITECTMTNIAIRDLAEFLKDDNHALKSDNCKLTKLGIRYNKITDEGAEYLSDALKSDNCKLTELDVGGNELTAKGVWQ